MSSNTAGSLVVIGVGACVATLDAPMASANSIARAAMARIEEYRRTSDTPIVDPGRSRFSRQLIRPPLNDAQAGPAVQFAAITRDQLVAAGITRPPTPPTAVPTDSMSVRTWRASTSRNTRRSWSSSAT